MNWITIKQELDALGIPIPADFPLDEWASALASDPTKNVTSMLGVTTVLFYLAERDHNPKVNDIWDALVYTSTCMSVGYGDIFAVTPLGKLIGSAIMTVGPTLASKALDGRKEPDPVQQEILATLKAILARLEPREAIEG